MNPIRPARKPGIAVKEIGGEALLYGTDEAAIHILNSTAQLIWELCDGEHTPADMEQAIRASFSVVNERDVAGDVRQTLEVLVSKGLLEQVA